MECTIMCKYKVACFVARGHAGVVLNRLKAPPPTSGQTRCSRNLSTSPVSQDCIHPERSSLTDSCLTEHQELQPFLHPVPLNHGLARRSRKRKSRPSRSQGSSSLPHCRCSSPFPWPPSRVSSGSACSPAQSYAVCSGWPTGSGCHA